VFIPGIFQRPFQLNKQDFLAGLGGLEQNKMPFWHFVGASKKRFE